MTPDNGRKLKAFVLLTMLSVPGALRVSSRVGYHSFQPDSPSFNADAIDPAFPLDSKLVPERFTEAAKTIEPSKSESLSLAEVSQQHQQSGLRSSFDPLTVGARHRRAGSKAGHTARYPQMDLSSPPHVAVAQQLLRSLPLRMTDIGAESVQPLDAASGGEAEDDSWRADEDWALLDSAAAFTVNNDEPVTFWSALSASTPELRARTPEACQRRWGMLAKEGSTSVVTGPEPATLNDWSRLPDGRMTGRVAGSAPGQDLTVWFPIAQEGRISADPRLGPGYVEAVGGRIYGLGSAANPEMALPDMIAAPTIALGLLVASVIGFGAGWVVKPPPPQPAIRIVRVAVSPGPNMQKVERAEQEQKVALDEKLAEQVGNMFPEEGIQ